MITHTSGKKKAGGKKNNAASRAAHAGKRGSVAASDGNRAEKRDTIDRGTLVDVVYDNINADIRKRCFTPGQKLIIRELSERYGISQTPIKQALNRLIADRVVENVPRYGVYVRRITWLEVEEAMQARLMVEEFCLPFVMRRARESDYVARMADIIQAHAALREETDFDSVFSDHIRLDMAFHQLLIGAASNSSISNYYTGLTSPIYLNYVYFGKKLQRLWDSCAEHQAIYQALVGGDIEALRTAVKRHNFNTTEDYRHILAADPVSGEAE